MCLRSEWVSPSRMKLYMKSILPFLLVAVSLMNTSHFALANESTEDPFLWLEEIDSDRSMEWVNRQNAVTRKRIAEDPLFEGLYRKNLEILDSDERIAYPNIKNDLVYNFWRDKTNKRGLLRRTAKASYLKGEAVWETVLDLDKLSRDEEVKWVYKGASWLRPDYKRALLRLSPGGGDAVVIREFDLEELSFVKDGFNLPKAKTHVSWIDGDHLYVGTDFGDNSMTDSGYPRVIKKWRRGTSIDEAETIFEGEKTDVSSSVSLAHRPEGIYHFFVHSHTFYTWTQYYLDGEKLIELDLPDDGDTQGPFKGELIIELKSDWVVEDETYPQGAIVSVRFESLIKGEHKIKLLVSPDPRASTASIRITQNQVLINRLENITNVLYRYDLVDGEWRSRKINTPTLGTFALNNTQPDSDSFFLNYEGFFTPDTLFFSDDGSSLSEIQSLPSFFDSSLYMAEQYEAVSKDGEKIPYFILHRKSMQLDGNNPTLIFGYGGFEISLKPKYQPDIAVSWLDKGGVYVVGNIRGGGEFGPRWHQAALKENRQRAYDDFIAIAENLIERNITSPNRLGISGGSNGGLLVGAVYTQRPDLFNAVVCVVPLLDMKRYNKLLAGASWMGEYGNPDIPEEWAFISRYSPYQNLNAESRYPEVFFYTSTRDDRVHPGHARKMMARMKALGHPALYFENIEGGHAGASTNDQAAYRLALTYAYLLQKLVVR